MEEQVVDVDADADEVTEFLNTESVTIDGNEMNIGQILSDIKTAHKELDEYKAGSLSLSQTLSEAADEVDDTTLKAVLSDLSDGAFYVYLRLHRGDMELMGERDGKYSNILNE